MRVTPGALSSEVDKAKSSEEPEQQKIKTGAEISTSVRTSVNRLIMAYSLAATVNEADFAEDYATRKMATMEDVLGTPDLEYASEKKTVSTYRYKTLMRAGAFIASQAAADSSFVEGLATIGHVIASSMVSQAGMIHTFRKKIRITKILEYWKKNAGKEGFHSRAIAPVDDIFILVEPDVRTILGFHKYAKMLKKLDTRKEKRESVLQYIDEVNKLITTGEK